MCANTPCSPSRQKVLRDLKGILTGRQRDPELPFCADCSLKIEMQCEQGVAALRDSVHQSLSSVISDLLTLGSQSLSVIHSFSTLWTLNTKSWCFRRIRRDSASDSEPDLRAGRAFPLRPVLQSDPSLNYGLPSCGPRAHPAHAECTCY